MIDLHETIRRLTAQGQAIRALAQTSSDEQSTYKPTPETWSLKEVMEHLYNEERLDFRRNLKEMFGEPQPRDQWLKLGSMEDGLAGFIEERQDSIAWLSALRSPDWAIEKELRFGPSETMTITAAEMLLSWVEHDVLHLRQLVELMHAWNEHQAAPYSLKYAGGW